MYLAQFYFLVMKKNINKTEENNQIKTKQNKATEKKTNTKNKNKTTRNKQKYTQQKYMHAIICITVNIQNSQMQDIYLYYCLIGEKQTLIPTYIYANSNPNISINNSNPNISIKKL